MFNLYNFPGLYNFSTTLLSVPSALKCSLRERQFIYIWLECVLNYPSYVSI